MKRSIRPLVRFEESEMKRMEWCMKFAEKIGIKDTDLILDIFEWFRLHFVFLWLISLGTVYIIGGGQE